MATAAAALRIDDDGAPWHATMLELAGAGIKEYPGGDDNPTILGWARDIGLTYPAQSDYADNYAHDAIAWCGVTMAHALTKNGIMPPFGPKDTDRWMWGDSFSRPEFFDKLDLPRRGAIVVFNWAAGGNHVGTLESWDAQARTLRIAGGNQKDGVNVATFAWDKQLKGFYWPRKLAAAQSPVQTPADVRRRMGEKITLAEARLENGKVAVYKLPPNDGGGTFEVAGINERYHPVMANKLRAMIERGEPDQAVRDAIGDYTASYTVKGDTWFGSWGLEFYGSDTIFHRGPTGAAKIVQRALVILGENIGQTGDNRDGVDGDIGPLSADAIRRQEGNFERFLAALRQAREEYEREDVGYRQNFWNGFTNRWNNQMVVARRFQAEQPKEGTIMPPTNQPPGTGLEPVPDITVSQTPEQELRMLRQMCMTLMLRLQRYESGETVPPVQQPTKPPVVEQPPAPPPPAAPASNSGLDLFAQLAALVTGGGAVVGGMTGAIDPGTATTVAGGSLIPLIGGALGLFNPTIGALFSRFAPVLGGWLQGRAAAPPTNPPTR